MFSQIIPLSFRFIGWNGQDFDVEGDAVVWWDEVTVGETTHLQILSHDFSRAIINGEELSWSEVQRWQNKYQEDYAEDLRCLLVSILN